MTEHKWLDFACFLNACSYGLENSDCPFLQLQQLDQYQKLEFLLNVTESKAEKLMNCCKKYRNSCEMPAQRLALRSLEVELLP